MEFTEKNIYNAIKKVSRWNVLGIHLGFSSDELDIIKRDSFDTSDAIIRLVGRWKSNDIEASWEKLANALRLMGHRDVADSLCPEDYTGDQAIGSANSALSVDSFKTYEQEQKLPFSSGFSDKQLAEWLKLYHGLSDEACEIIKSQSITGEVFIELTKDEMKDLKFNFGTQKILLKVQETISVKEPEKVVKDKPKIGTTATTRTVLEDHHYGKIVGQLTEVKAQWERIAAELGFKPHEIDNIRSLPTRVTSGNYYLDVITGWLNWAPGDKRGSEDVATLEALQAALNNTNNAKIKLTL